jgi:hypothetical protein
MSDPGDPMEIGHPRGSNNPIGIGPMESSPIRPLSPNGSILQSRSNFLPFLIFFILSLIILTIVSTGSLRMGIFLV